MSEFKEYTVVSAKIELDLEQPPSAAGLLRIAETFQGAGYKNLARYLRGAGDAIQASPNFSSVGAAAEMRRRAMRAHEVCYSAMLANPLVVELQDDGVLHNAIHDILRVDGGYFYGGSGNHGAPAIVASVDARGEVDSICAALGNLVAGDTLDREDERAIDRARSLIRRLATAEQPGSAVQGDAALRGKYGDVLRPFVVAMEAELHANAGKGDRPGWLAMSPQTALLEIYYHLGKLQRAVKKEGGDLIREYAADVANMSMMLLDICGGLALIEDTTPPPAPAAEQGHIAEGVFAEHPDSTDRATFLYFNAKGDVPVGKEVSIFLAAHPGRMLPARRENKAGHLPAVKLLNNGFNECLDELGRQAVTQPEARGAEEWRPMDTAPRDGTMVRLLVQFDDHATEDSEGPAPTIGENNDDNVGPGEGTGWQFAGWCWTHDHFTEGKGTPVGWLPMLAAAPSGVRPVTDEMGSLALGARVPGTDHHVRDYILPCAPPASPQVVIVAALTAALAGKDGA